MIRFLDHHVTDGAVKARVHYSIDNRAPGRPKCVTIYAKDYSRKLGALFGTAYKNATDSQTDYFDEGHVTLEEGHPLYASARAAAELAAARWTAHVARTEQKRAARKAARADAFRRWVITHNAYEPGMMSFVVTASSAAYAWAKFVRQRFGALKPSRSDYTISEAL